MVLPLFLSFNVVYTTRASFYLQKYEKQGKYNSRTPQVRAWQGPGSNLVAAGGAIEVWQGAGEDCQQIKNQSTNETNSSIIRSVH